MRLRGAPGVGGIVLDAPGLAFAARPVEDWDGVEDELAEAFRLTRQAAAAGESIVYLVHSADLLGQRGAPAAMLACGLLGCARAMALEGRRTGVRANVLAYERPEGLEPWLSLLLERPDVTGEVVRLGSSHVGRVLP